jgi:hypothetical protein
MSQYAVKSAEAVGPGVGTGVGPSSTGVGSGVGAEVGCAGVGSGVGCAGVGSGVGPKMQAYSAKNANLQPLMVTLPQFPLPCMFFKYAVPLLHTDVLTVT